MAVRGQVLLGEFLLVRSDSVQVPVPGPWSLVPPVVTGAFPGRYACPGSGMPRTGHGSWDPGARFASPSGTGLGSGRATTRPSCPSLV